MPSFRVADLASLFARTFSQCALCECANNEKAKDGHENFLHSHLPVRFCFFFRRVFDAVVANGKRALIKELPAEDFAGSQVGLEFDGMKSSDLPVLTHGHSNG